MTEAFDLQAEIRDLAARRDIGQAVARYARGLDRLDRDLVRSAFHPDAVVEAGLFKGAADAFAGFCMDFLGAMGGSHHLLGQHLLTIEGDRASGELYFQAWHAALPEGGATDLFISGRYLDDYARRDGEWRIARRMLVTDWVTDDPADGSFFAANPGSIRGARRGADPSEASDRSGHAASGSNY